MTNPVETISSCNIYLKFFFTTFVVIIIYQTEYMQNQTWLNEMQIEQKETQDSVYFAFASILPQENLLKIQI